MKGPEDERELTDRILKVMNCEAKDLKDTLSCQSVFVLHSEAALQFTETLRVGSGTNPDESILLRDYLRLFAPFVPKESIEPKVHDLIEKAWEKLRYDPDAAVKEMEEYAESFGHPETYRELLRFYQVRNVEAMTILRRAQRLWEITRDSSDIFVWGVVLKYFTPRPPFSQKSGDWSPNMDFMRALWRDAGMRDPLFGLKLAEAYGYQEKASIGADVLLEIIKSSEPSPSVLSRIVPRCIYMLDAAKRSEETEVLIQQFKPMLAAEKDFATAWARHALRVNNKAAIAELTKLPVSEQLRTSLAATLYVRAGMTEKARAFADGVLREIADEEIGAREAEEFAGLFREIGRSEEFEELVAKVFPQLEPRERASRYRRRLLSRE